MLGNNTLILTRASDTFAGSFTGNGSVTLASGAETLTGTSTIGGTLAVDSGTLHQNGTFTAGAVAVASGGTLRGTGLIAAPTSVNGVLAPGNSPGTMTFTAPVTLSSSATLALDIDGTGTGNGAGNYSRVVVQGAAFTAAGAIAPLLRGITGSASNTFTPPIGSVYNVVLASGGVQGSFGSLLQPSAGLLPGTHFDAL
jgi:fibronectin-binding autotransporter adhesin